MVVTGFFVLCWCQDSCCCTCCSVRCIHDYLQHDTKRMHGNCWCDTNVAEIIGQQQGPLWVHYLNPSIANCSMMTTILWIIELLHLHHRHHLCCHHCHHHWHHNQHWYHHWQHHDNCRNNHDSCCCHIPIGNTIININVNIIVSIIVKISYIIIIVAFTALLL